MRGGKTRCVEPLREAQAQAPAQSETCGETELSSPLALTVDLQLLKRTSEINQALVSCSDISEMVINT
jgi:hypothetical protein